jgi:hypothetical protein
MRRRSLLQRVVLTTVVGSTFASTSATATVDQPVRAGDLRVVFFDDPTKVAERGGSATRFTVKFPDGAACPGDSANDQWRTQSFVIPVGTDPVTLGYNNARPEGERNWPLYGDDTVPYINQLLFKNAAPGKPGEIPPVPALSFATLPPGSIADGQYRVGIACTYFRHTAKYWDTKFVFVNDSSDVPGQLSWRLASSPPAPPDESDGSTRAVLIALGALVLAGSAISFVRLIRWGRSRPHTRTADEATDVRDVTSDVATTIPAHVPTPSRSTSKEHRS